MDNQQLTTTGKTANFTRNNWIPIILGVMLIISVAIGCGQNSKYEQSQKQCATLAATLVSHDSTAQADKAAFLGQIDHLYSTIAKDSTTIANDKVIAGTVIAELKEVGHVK
jgi:hypothetical protein